MITSDHFNHSEYCHLQSNVNTVHQTGVKCHLMLNYSSTNVIKIVAQLSVTVE